jgi:hypothetical protein
VRLGDEYDVICSPAAKTTPVRALPSCADLVRGGDEWDMLAAATAESPTDRPRSTSTTEGGSIMRDGSEYDLVYSGQ